VHWVCGSAALMRFCSEGWRVDTEGPGTVMRKGIG
jgi:hypothetical protein